MIKLKQFINTILLACAGFVYAQYTAIPDPIFEQFLIHQSFDDVLDGQVLTSRIRGAFSLEINGNDPVFPIEDLTGIEDFTSLEFLSINVTNCLTVDFGNLPNLEILQFFSNSNLTNIDISGCLNLVQLIFNRSPISSLDVSQHIPLRKLILNKTKTSTIDVSQNPNIVWFGITDENVTQVDLRNGANENMEFFYALESPNLNCILVDNVAYSNANWTTIDPPVNFVETQAACDALSTESFTQSNFKLYPNPVSETFTIDANQNIDRIEIYNSTGKKVKVFKEVLEQYSVSGLTDGIYFLKIFEGERFQMKKL